MKLLMIGAPEIIFIVLIVLLLFGGKKIPELMRGLGKGVRSFKEGMNDIEGEIKKPLDEQPQQGGQQNAQQSAPQGQPNPTQPSAPQQDTPANGQQQ